jgi:hypothetical protein
MLRGQCGIEPLTCPPKSDPQVRLAGRIKERQGNEPEAVYSGADQGKAAGSRGGLGLGADGRPGVPYPGHCRTDLLSLAPGVWWLRNCTGQAAHSFRARACPAETGGIASHPGQINPPGSGTGKLPSPTRRRQCIEPIGKFLPVSERRECGVTGQPLATRHYRASEPDDEVGLTAAIIGYQVARGGRGS